MENETASGAAPTDPSRDAADRTVIRSQLRAWVCRPGAVDDQKVLETHSVLLQDLEERFMDMRALDGPLPRSVGAFEVKHHLGRGGMGVVYSGIHPETSTEVALKLVPLSRPRRVKALELEASRLSEVNHPNVVRVLAWGRDKGFAWVALELIKGRDLRQCLDFRTQSGESFFESFGDSPSSTRRRSDRRRHTKVPKEPIHLMEMFRDLARALHALHAAGLVHRDVKPANIMVRDDGKAVLIDFGLAVSDEESPVVGELAGTLPYMSPEQTLSGRVDLEPQSDLYSLAVTFHEALSGARVAHRAGDAALLLQIALSEVPPVSRTSRHRGFKRLDPVFAMALAKHPDDRYRSGEALAEDLDCWLEDRPLRWAPEPSRLKLSRQVRHHPAATGLLAAILLASVAWLTVPTYLHSRDLDATLTETIKLQTAGETELALSRCAREAERFITDETFKTRYQMLASLVGPELTERILTKSSFAIPGRPEPRMFRDLAVSANRHLQFLDDPNFLFHRAYFLYRKNQHHEISNLLEGEAHRDLVNRDPLLLELLALAYVELDEPERAVQIEGRLRNRGRAPNASELCLRAMRRFRQVEKAREHGQAVGEDTRTALKTVERDVEAILQINEKHQLARTLLGLLQIRTRRFDEARRTFMIVHKASSDGDRDGILLWCALARVLTASTTKGDDARPIWLKALADASLAIKADARLLEDFVGLVMHYSGAVAALECCRRVLLMGNRHFPVPSQEFWLIAKDAAQVAYFNHGFDAVIRIADAAAANPIDCTDSEANKAFHIIQVCWVGSLCHQARDARDGADAAATIHETVEAIRKRVKQELARYGSPSADLEYAEAEALVLAYDVADRPEYGAKYSRLAKRRLVRLVGEDGLIQKAMRRAEGDKQRKVLESLRQSAEKMLNSLRSGDRR